MSSYCPSWKAGVRFSQGGKFSSAVAASHWRLLQDWVGGDAMGNASCCRFVSTRSTFFKRCKTCANYWNWCNRATWTSNDWWRLWNVNQTCPEPTYPEPYWGKRSNLLCMKHMNQQWPIHCGCRWHSRDFAFRGLRPTSLPGSFYFTNDYYCTGSEASLLDGSNEHQQTWKEMNTRKGDVYGGHVFGTQPWWEEHSDRTAAILVPKPNRPRMDSVYRPYRGQPMEVNLYLPHFAPLASNVLQHCYRTSGDRNGGREWLQSFDDLWLIQALFWVRGHCVFFLVSCHPQVSAFCIRPFVVGMPKALQVTSSGLETTRNVQKRREKWTISIWKMYCIYVYNTVYI